MVRRRLHLAEDDDEATTRERIDATIAEFVPDEDDRRWVKPALLTLLGLAPAPAGGRDVLFAAWRIFFERVADRGTTVLLFEDLQWADTGLLDFIEYLLEWSRTSPILVVALARPELFERRPDWGAGVAQPDPAGPRAADRRRDARAARRLRAGPAEARRSTRSSPAPTGCRCTRSRRSGRSSPRAGSSARARPTGLPGALGELAIPETLRSLIASRLDALDAGRSEPRRRRRGARPVVHAGRPRRDQRPRSGRARAAPPGPRPARDLRGRGRSALARARPVRLRPVADPRGRLRHPGQARAAHPAPRRGALLRGARRRRAGRRARLALPRRPRGIGRGRRGGRGRDPGPDRPVRRRRSSGGARRPRPGRRVPALGRGDHRQSDRPSRPSCAEPPGRRTPAAITTRRRPWPRRRSRSPSRARIEREPPSPRPCWARS